MLKKSKKEVAREAELKRIIESVPVPRSDFECNDYVGTVGDLQRELERIQLDMNAELEAVKAKYVNLALPASARLSARLSAIEAYCDANRSALTENGKVKFHAFDSGVVNWREAPPKVSLRKVETIVAWLLEQKGKFRKFVRVKHEIDKETMLKDPDLAKQVPGVKIESAGEAFYVTPNETKLEVLA